MAKVTYIEQDHDPEDEDPENITLPSLTDESVREACTIQQVNEDQNVKTKTETDTDEGSVFIIPENEENELEGHNMDAIADVVKATLANQTGKTFCTNL